VGVKPNNKEPGTKRLTRRERHIRVQREKEKEKRRFSRNDFLLSAVFVLGLVLMVFEIQIFRNTVLETKMALFIYVGTSVIALPFTSKMLSNYQGAQTLFLKLIFNLGAVGGTCLFSFMALNYYLPQNGADEIQVAILERGSLGSSDRSCRSPYVMVEIYGKEKQLVFPCSADVESNNFVNLYMARGLFGIPIILQKDLVMTKDLAP